MQAGTWSMLGWLAKMSLWGYRDSGKEHGNYYRIYWGYIGIMEKKMDIAI